MLCQSYLVFFIISVSEMRSVNRGLRETYRSYGANKGVCPCQNESIFQFRHIKLNKTTRKYQPSRQKQIGDVRHP